MAKFGVFTRNYRQHISASGTGGVFRSSVRWARPARALDKGQEIDVYIAPVDGNGEVKFRAKLKKVKLDPKEHDPEVKEMLQKAPSTTEKEGLWEGNVATLYELAEIIEINPSFHFTELKKLDGGENINPEYSRAYCIVRAID